jgi:hypothetical protein
MIFNSNLPNNNLEISIVEKLKEELNYSFPLKFITVKPKILEIETINNKKIANKTNITSVNNKSIQYTQIGNPGNLIGNNNL